MRILCTHQYKQGLIQYSYMQFKLTVRQNSDDFLKPWEGNTSNPD